MTLNQKRNLAAYYTPETVTNTLCTWAIRNINDTILEPSFGGCNFLTSSMERLRRLGNDNPVGNIFGFDIDTHAFDLLYQRSIDATNFRNEDFLHSSVANNPIQVSVIIGNPPYVPIHKLDNEYKNDLYKRFKRSVIKIPKRSSLWVYFIIHSLQYLTPGGRMAWVVPDSISFTDYGKHLLKQLIVNFSKVQLLRTDERYFYDVGTHEKTAILLCENYQAVGETVEVSQYANLRVLLDAIASNNTRKNAIITEKSEVIFPGFFIRKLGDVFTTRIGIVIGATKLLTYKKKEAFESEFYPQYLYPIITKGKQLKNIVIDKKHLLQIDDLPVYLLNAIDLEQRDPSRFEKFLTEFPQEILINQTFSTRPKLFGYDDFLHPDAFLTYFSQGLPKLVINKDKELNCTNSVHRLFLNEAYKKQSWVANFIAIQLYSGLLKDQVIDLARQYGNNIKKFEPCDAQKIPVLIPISFSQAEIDDLYHIFEIIADHVNAGAQDEAKRISIEYLNNIISEHSDLKVQTLDQLP